MACVIKEADFGASQSGTELHHGAQQLIARGVVFFDHHKAEIAQSFSHGLGIVGGVAQRTHGGLVLRIANNEGGACRGRGMRSQGEGGQQQKASEAEAGGHGRILQSGTGRSTSWTGAIG